jgi:adenylate cyclase
MNCAGCGFALEAGFAFCPKCGARQPAPCAGCGYPCPPDFAFCPKCGCKQAAGEAPPAAPPPATSREPSPPASPAPAAVSPALAGEADRRTVTVLFADLSGFTTLSERLDPEIMQVLQNELFEELTAAVQEFGGFVDKFVGDALLALFGAPHAHEDDPERALNAALAMLERTARLDQRWRGRAGLPLALHLGVNTGPVVTGGFGAGSAKSYSVTGDTVNTAQRLQSLAGNGEVLVGPATCRLARHAFGFESMGEVALKGKSGQHLVHRLIGRLEAPREARGLEALGLSAPLIGRDAELGRMLDCLERAVAGDAHVVRLIGEAGIGKSRLVRELLARVEDDERFAPVVVRRATCSPLGEQHFGALATILRSAYDIAPKDSATVTREKLAAGIAALGLSPAEGAELMPSLDHVLGLGAVEAGRSQVEPEQLKRQIHFAVRTLFERRLARAPVLLVVEDLHWADAASLEVIRLLADRLDRSRLMIVLTHRPAFEAGALATSRSHHVAIRLPPLPVPSGHALIDALFGGSPLPPALRARIVERADGNPLFLEEIVRGLIENGALAHPRRGRRGRDSAQYPGHAAGQARSPAARGPHARPGGRGGRPALRCRPAARHRQRPRPAAQPARSAARRRADRRGAGPGPRGAVPLHSVAAPGRDLPKPLGAAAHGAAWPRRTRARSPAAGRCRAARGPSRPRPPFLPQRRQGEGRALPRRRRRSGQRGLRQ